MGRNGDVGCIVPVLPFVGLRGAQAQAVERQQLGERRRSHSSRRGEAGSRRVRWRVRSDGIIPSRHDPANTAGAGP